MIVQRIERAFSKDKILELYLNEIFFGFNSYGIAAASLNYFGKSLNDLTLDEMAYLAALPKGPNNYHPVPQQGPRDRTPQLGARPDASQWLHL